MSGPLAVRMPRCLLDPRLHQLPPGDADGLVAVELQWQGGQIHAIRPLAAAAGPLPLALTPLVEPHAHLDKAFSAAAFPNRDGTMAAALAANRRELAERTAEQVLARGEAALQRAWRQGLRAVRSHVDCIGVEEFGAGGLGAAGPGADGLSAAVDGSWQAMVELRRRWRDRLELQLVALVPLELWSSPAGEGLARRVAADGGWLGGVIGPPYGEGSGHAQQLLALASLGERHGVGLDLHVDESDRQPGRGVAALARLVLEQRLALPITCSHASSMSLLPAPAVERLAERLAAAELAVVALPTTNAWLLGREPERTPVRRPMAPIRSLQRAGVRLAIGGDNVQDAWFPGGDFDPLALLAFTAVVAQLPPWQRQGLAPYTTTASAVLGLAWDGVLRQGGPADLVVLAARHWGELLARPPQRRVLRAGRWLEPPPSEQPSPLLATCR